MIEPRPFRAFGRLIDFMRQADEPGLINLAAGVPGLDSLPVEALKAAFARALAQEGPKMFGYHHPEGDHELREILAARLQARGTNVRGPQVVTVTGCTQGVQLLISILIRPGDIVAVESPAYYGMLEVLSAAGAHVLPLPVTGQEGFDLDTTEDLLARWRPRALIVCAALSNPSGATLPEAKRGRLVEICRTHGVRLIEDDIYGELVEDGVPRSLLAWDDGSTVSYVSSFSKTVSPGLRVGVCVPGTLQEDFATRKCQQDLHSAVVSEVALREFLAAGVMEPHLAGLRMRNLRRRTMALETITATFPTGTRVHPPRGGYMLWAELPHAIDLEQARASARQEDIVFGAGPVFFTEPQSTTSLRLNCAQASEHDLVAGLEKLGAILRAQPEQGLPAARH